jgi:NADH-quinone oxidoreductase subunit L
MSNLSALWGAGRLRSRPSLPFYLAFKSDGALQSTTPLLDHIWTWLQVGAFRADFALAMDRLSGTYALFVTFVGFLIHVFAAGYMHGEAGFYRFFAFLNLFMFAMLTLVLADNFVLMFVGWEGVGLCSYLLIGYYLDRDEAASAAKKAFITNRIGDWGFVLGIMLTFFVTGSVSFFANPLAGATTQTALSFFKTQPVDPFTAGAILAGGATSIAVLLFIGAAGKSAQIPLYVWLPDAMAGPTPVSALIHAATMVTAGVYMIVRCSEIFVHAPTAMFIVAIIGAATALFAATIGLAQNDIKKVLAYSTISQLGYMFLACGVGAFIAAIFHVITHAFFKALLFLGSGSVIHGMHHEQDMRRMGGLKKYMPVTFATMVTGWLAISGVPIFAGFFSKDEILWKTWSAPAFSLPSTTFSKLLWVIGAITAFLTAVYMTRMMVMTFWGSERFRETHSKQEEPDHHHHGPVEPHESPWVMTVPLIVLAVLSTVGGFIGVPYALSSVFADKDINVLEHTLEPVAAHMPASAHGVTESHGEAVPTAASDTHAPASALDGTCSGNGLCYRCRACSKTNTTLTRSTTPQ